MRVVLDVVDTLICTCSTAIDPFISVRALRAVVVDEALSSASIVKGSWCVPECGRAQGFVLTSPPDARGSPSAWYLSVAAQRSLAAQWSLAAVTGRAMSDASLQCMHSIFSERSVREYR